MQISMISSIQEVPHSKTNSVSQEAGQALWTNQWIVRPVPLKAWLEWTILVKKSPCWIDWSSSKLMLTSARPNNSPSRKFREAERWNLVARWRLKIWIWIERSTLKVILSIHSRSAKRRTMTYQLPVQTINSVRTIPMALRCGHHSSYSKERNRWRGNLTLAELQKWVHKPSTMLPTWMI